jgi:hypothetical protein
LSRTEPDFHYANLAVRSLRLEAIVKTQVPAAVAMRPSLVTIAGGGNDLLSLRVSVDDLARRFDEAVEALTESGAAAIVFAGFDPRAQLPLGRFIAARTAAYNARLIATAKRYGAFLIDLWSMPELNDRRLWSPDRLHLSAIGHLHVAGVVLSRLGRPAPDGWPVDLGPSTAGSRLHDLVTDTAWARRDLLPWVVRKVRGRSAGDGLTAKYPYVQSWSAETPSTCARC